MKPTNMPPTPRTAEQHEAAAKECEDAAKDLRTEAAREHRNVGTNAAERALNLEAQADALEGRARMHRAQAGLKTGGR